MFPIALVRTAILSIQLAAAAPSSTISTCELVHAEDFVGQLVRINAVMGFTMHGIYLLSDPCNKSDVPDAAVLFPKTDDTPKVDFDLDLHAVKMLQPFLRPTGGAATACGVFTGQLFYRKNFRSRIFGAGPQGNGFGSRGALRVAFVLQAVNEIHPCERTPK